MPRSLQFVQQQYQVPQVAPESVQTPAHEHVEPSATSGLEQVVQRRSSVLRTRHTPVNVFDNRPSEATSQENVSRSPQANWGRAA
ncbi:MAG TPA: hypothetical protein VFT39_10125 [Vicinamibacterales bacterium]|nr:hypothetical protein [Vicinamibacterales bacterium]